MKTLSDIAFVLGLASRHFTDYLAHTFGHHKQRVELWETRSGQLMRGTRCQCGRLEDIRPLGLRAQQNKKQEKYHWS